MEKMDIEIDPSEVVAIHFGNKSFKEYEFLKQIDDWARMG
jgi:hypothetical protein